MRALFYLVLFFVLVQFSCVSFGESDPNPTATSASSSPSIFGSKFRPIFEQIGVSGPQEVATQLKTRLSRGIELSKKLFYARSPHHNPTLLKRTSDGEEKEVFDLPPEGVQVVYYDYVIVGSGPAGCVLGNRLSEADQDDLNPSTVLVLERGINTSHVDFPFGQQPRFADTSMTLSPASKSYSTLRNPHIFDRSVLVHAGRGLGGTTNLNGMIAVRPHRSDFDGWVEHHGLSGWSWYAMLPYLIRMENNSGESESRFHGKDGFLPVGNEPAELRTPFQEAFLASASNIGMHVTTRISDGEAGAGYTQKVIANGHRVSAYDAYLKPIIDHRPNLRVLSGATVLRLFFDEHRSHREGSQRVIGVLYQHRGGIFYAIANREVILAAGAFESPKLLMLSGIGDRDLLASVGIRSRVHLPGVGQNLQDSIGVPTAYGTIAENPKNNATKLMLAQLEWLSNSSSGLLSVTGNPIGVFFSSEDPTRGGTEVKVDSQFYLVDGLPLHITPIENVIGMSCWNVMPKSRGFVGLFDSDPLQDPAIHLNYLSNSDDIKVLLQCMKLVHRIAATPPISNMLAFNLAPGIPEQIWSGDESLLNTLLEQVIRGSCNPGYHFGGTCQMGNDTDPMAVLDEDLRVRGIDGLRVADMSIQPIIVRTNPMLSLYAIAERAADLVKETYQRKPTKLLRLSSPCNGHWLVENPNNHSVVFRWQLVDRDLNGIFSVGSGAQAVFFTEAFEHSLQMKITVNGEIHDSVTLNSSLQSCEDNLLNLGTIPIDDAMHQHGIAESGHT